MKNKKIFIVGGGLAGAATAYFLKRRGLKVPIFEQEKNYGGLCRSVKKNGFTFDYSGHLLHFRSPKTLSLVKKILKGNLTKHKRQSFIYTCGQFILSPFQANFYNLPSEIAKKCLEGLREAHNNGGLTAKKANFQGWITSNFGKGIADHFMIPYNLKFWKTPLNKLSYEWADRFIIRQPYKKVKSSFSHKVPQNLGYNAYFWYPQKGGIEELIKGFYSYLDDIYLEHKLKGIDLKKRELLFKGGRKEKFDTLISTLPLPELLKIIKNLPDNIESSLSKLNWISIYNINFGLEGKVQPNRHWIYFPQNQLKFFRAGFYHNFSKSLAPSNKSALYVEISYSKNNHFAKDKIEGQVLKDLRTAGIIGKDNKIKTKCINDIKYAYPIYDHNWKKSRLKVLRYLCSQGILSVGRFGSWRYLSMEDVILEAEETAKLISC